MIVQSVHIPLQTTPFDLQACLKGSWLVLLHARRTPPHVGLVIEGGYNSLTIKGHELKVPVEALHKTVMQKKIEALFIKVAAHPVFSPDYQLAVLQELIRKFPSVKQQEATCLSPIKEFFQEFYTVAVREEELLFDFIERLNDNSFLEQAASVNFDLEHGQIVLPFYTAELLNERIRQERQPFYNDMH